MFQGLAPAPDALPKIFVGTEFDRSPLSRDGYDLPE
jgi:hypothetical protein